MLNDLCIPRMGSVENARLLNWRVAEGETFEVGQILYEVETDKTTVEVEADAAGVLAKRTASEGEEFKVGDKVGVWAAPGTMPTAIAKALGQDAAPKDVSAAQPTNVVSTPAIGAVPSADVRPLPRAAAVGRKVSPLARRLAAQFGVDLAQVNGTGLGGKIGGSDVLAARDAGQVKAPLAAPAVPPLPPAVSAPVAEDGELVPHTMRRRTIAQRMSLAASIPTLTADMEIDLGALMAFRKSPQGAGTSVLGLIAHAATSALIEHPRLNAHWRDDAMVAFRSVHLGIAVDAADGLVVPVIRHAERLSPLGLTQAIADLAARARAGQLRPEEMEGGSFTISNPGSIGPVIRAEALLNPPQVALLGLPGIVRAPVAVRHGEDWAMAVRPVIRASLSFDHRALDGGSVIRFLNTLKSRIESL
ncbi:dihydrolipoamide acetyltransferase family protein [Novosphingobium jiangmenense]|uniref:Dihydrolipoamide acetyltransferase component of pyruvate dehydrogenase complex n=1 Tax=Novosphingobium jiangmenense TaxID=2791981 RepID=A0ABS0HJ65_9SPHN|nr:dihydrolipoamide acetyltransferase family protein [Novosphingobium jiangmenense]MBF9152276.1 2-oxo acid dehydrogenase subunit E2 [Novosphingobium jiangmenense]